MAIHVSAVDIYISNFHLVSQLHFQTLNLLRQVSLLAIALVLEHYKLLLQAVDLQLLTLDTFRQLLLGPRHLDLYLLLLGH